MNSRRGMFVFVVAVLTCFVPALFAGTGYKKYVDTKQYGFEVEVPQSWVVQAIGKSGIFSGGAIFSGAEGTEEYYTTITFQFVPLQLAGESGKTLDGQVEIFLKQMRTAPKFMLVKKVTGKLAGCKAVQMVVQYQLKGTNDLYRQEQYIVLCSSYFCWVGYTAPTDLFKRYHSAMDHATQTLKFVEVAGAAAPDKMQNYRNTKYGFEVSVPDDWRVVKEPPKSIVRFYGPKKEVLVQVSGAKIKPGVTEEAMLNAFEKTSVGEGSIYREATAHGKVIIDGREAPYGKYRIVSKGVEGMSKVIFFDNKKGYCLVLALIAPAGKYDVYERVFSKIVKTFRSY